MSLKIIEEALKAVPCAARLGLLCPAKHFFWAPCCRLLKAINSEGQPIDIQELEDNQLHILLYKRPDAVKESYGVVELIKPTYDEDWDIEEDYRYYFPELFDLSH